MDLFKKDKRNPSSQAPQKPQGPQAPQQITANLRDNIDVIRQMLGPSSDIIVREIEIGINPKLDAAIIYTDGLSSGTGIQNLLDSLLLDFKHIVQWQEQTKQSNSKRGAIADSYQLIKERVLNIGEIDEITEFNELFTQLLSGDVIFLIDGVNKALQLGLRQWKERAIEKSEKELVVRGPHQSFTESMATNKSMLRRIIKSPHLWIESRIVGRFSQTDVAIAYIQGVVNEEVLTELHQRLDRIDIDAIIDSSYIEEFIQDNSYTPFPTVFNSERPDVIAAELLEGKIAIMTDGSPTALIVPAPFVSFIHAAEDYYQRADISSLVRIIRYIAIVISLLAPAFYVAIVSFHHEMLPTLLLISLSAQREGVPFPAFIEAIVMELMFEILREAGLRMPKSIGQAVSIVGTLVLGTAAVEAGFVSAAMVIVVSATAVSSFVFPVNGMSIAFRMLRFPMLVIAGCFGLFGIMVGLAALALHLCHLRSFGLPYMAPFAPFVAGDQQDAIVRFPRWAMIKRPKILNTPNQRRQQHDEEDKPNPTKPDERADES